MSETVSGNNQELRKLDVMSLIRDFLHSLRRLWPIVLALTVIAGALMYFRSSKNYSPQYTAEATVSVEAGNGGTYSNRNTAEQMARVFPYILSSGALSDVIAADLGVKSVPGTISAKSISGTNLLTISVKAWTADNAYNVLQSVLKNYPSVAQYVIGQTKLNVVDDGGVPVDTGKTAVVRGSLKKGALAGFIVGIIIVIIHAATTRTIRSESELISILNVNCLGTLPECSSKKHNKKDARRQINILYDSNRGEYIESMRRIRTRLERQMEGKKVLMVTSSVAGEGKSTVAANLAISLALKGNKVILVDCDLRNPSVGKIFNLEGNYPGLASVLNGTASVDDSMVEISDTKIPQGLFLIPGAAHSSRMIEILSSNEMGHFVEKLRERADIVILDTPPSAVLVDAMMLVRHVDAVAYVIMCDYARRRSIMDGVEELSAGNAPIAGCILNGGNVHSGKYGYYGYYGRYGYYGNYGYGRYGYGYGYGYGSDGRSEKKHRSSRSKSKKTTEKQ